MMTKKQLANTFSMEVEYIVKEHKMSYMDAVLWFSQQREIEPETAANLLNTNIKNKLEAEARELHFLPKKTKLPI
jgi:hypothetical protein